MNRLIWDLDGTLIDSSHRYRTLPCGGIDLDAWIRLNTPENVWNDKLLPLAEIAKDGYASKTETVFCTARVLNEWDYDFLADNGLFFHNILSRPEGLTLDDANFKEFHLRLYAQNKGISWQRFCAESVFFEDAHSVIERMKLVGLPTFNAATCNRVLANG